jgi:hypothetical protein
VSLAAVMHLVFTNDMSRSLAPYWGSPILLLHVELSEAVWQPAMASHSFFGASIFA